MIVDVVIAVCIAVGLGLLLIFIGRVLKTGGKAPLLAAIGGTLEEYGWLIGLLLGILWFVSGAHWPP